ncbi:PqqD family protein [Pelagicoccus sp. NFK12]|uniref:PqqD family protein n=1 Tax=Pelagicoccus enzymogenes TaxID=2773457 RepID=A0A927IIB6_9BACT|nr:PqqD family protein [Pelagicoccus enzymogenes]MBD5781096.1 PqqD family protein [Pelagicoccus enzymogenes]
MHFQRSKENVSCKLEDDTVVLDPKTGAYFRLNSVGARIWTLIDQPADLSTIVETLQGEYEITRDRCEHESLAFLEMLKEKGLLASDASST